MRQEREARWLAIIVAGTDGDVVADRDRVRVVSSGECRCLRAPMDANAVGIDPDERSEKSPGAR